MLHRIGSEPDGGVNDFSVDHHLEVEVAAGGGAGGPTEGHHVAPVDLLADLDAG